MLRPNTTTAKFRGKSTDQNIIEGLAFLTWASKRLSRILLATSKHAKNTKYDWLKRWNIHQYSQQTERKGQSNQVTSFLRSIVSQNLSAYRKKAGSESWPIQTAAGVWFRSKITILSKIKSLRRHCPNNSMAAHQPLSTSYELYSRVGFHQAALGCIFCRFIDFRLAAQLQA